MQQLQQDLGFRAEAGIRRCLSTGLSPAAGDNSVEPPGRIPCQGGFLSSPQVQSVASPAPRRGEAWPHRPAGRWTHPRSPLPEPPVVRPWLRHACRSRPVQRHALGQPTCLWGPWFEAPFGLRRSALCGSGGAGGLPSLQRTSNRPTWAIFASSPSRRSGESPRVPGARGPAALQPRHRAIRLDWSGCVRASPGAQVRAPSAARPRPGTWRATRRRPRRAVSWPGHRSRPRCRA